MCRAQILQPLRLEFTFFRSSMQAIFRREAISFVRKSQLTAGEDAGERNMLF